MTASLADRLAAARARAFVGRAAEVALFRQALAACPDPPFSVLWLHGPASRTWLERWAGRTRPRRMSARAKT